MRLARVWRLPCIWWRLRRKNFLGGWEKADYRVEFSHPGEVIFAEFNFEPAFGGKQIHRKAAFPQRDHQGK